MNKETGLLYLLGKASAFLSKYFAVVILLTSAFAFMHPEGFTWIPSYTALFLGTAMFGMGLTIKRQDFQIVFSRPKEIFAGCVLQYTIMPFAAYLLAVVLNLDTDLALGVILVGCCPGGTASNVIAYIAKGDVPLSVGMTIASTLIAPLVTPFLVYVLAGAWVEVSFWAMVMSVVNIVLLPVLAGIILNSLFHDTIEKLGSILPLVSIVAIVTIIDGIVAVSAGKLMSCGLIVIALVVLHNGIGLGMGLFMAKVMKVNYAKETSIAIEVAMQNSGLAVALATVNFAANPLASLPGAVFSVWHNVAGSMFASYRIKGLEGQEAAALDDNALTAK